MLSFSDFETPISPKKKNDHQQNDNSNATIQTNTTIREQNVGESSTSISTDEVSNDNSEATIQTNTTTIATNVNSNDNSETTVQTNETVRDQNALSLESHSTDGQTSSQPWTLEEDRLILKQIFLGKERTTITNKNIQKVRSATLAPLVSLLQARTESSINGRWRQTLKPIISAYLSGDLHFDWNGSFARQLIGKKICSAAEIDWKEEVENLPARETFRSFRHLVKLFSENENLPLFRSAKREMSNMRREHESEESRKHRREIAHFFDKMTLPQISIRLIQIDRASNLNQSGFEMCSSQDQDNSDATIQPDNSDLMQSEFENDSAAEENSSTKMNSSQGPKRTGRKSSAKSESDNSQTTIQQTKRKGNENDDSQKSYDDWSPIQEGFGDLLNHLKPEKREVDKIVKFVLDQNIRVRHFNLMFQDSTFSFTCLKTKLEGKNYKVKFGQFSRKEDDLIRKAWDQLVNTAEVQSPAKCFKELTKVKVNNKF